MSFSNNYIVKFGRAKGITPPVGFDQLVEFMCDEAQLPNVNIADGTINGLYQGQGSIRYPHTRVFTELQLGFMLDANMEILKYLNGWHDYIFGEPITDAAQPKAQNRVNRLQYMDNYVCNIYIMKTETGPNSTTQRNPITYVIERAYPYAIDAIPLQFGSSQITRVTAQFTYARHYTTGVDIRSITGDVAGMPKRDVVTAPERLVQKGPDGNVVTWPPLTPPPALPSSPSQVQDPRAKAAALGT